MKSKGLLFYFEIPAFLTISVLPMFIVSQFNLKGLLNGF